MKEEIPIGRSFVSTIGSNVFFSKEELDFGMLLPSKTCHHIIILYNISKNDKLNFEFGSSALGMSLSKPALMW